MNPGDTFRTYGLRLEVTAAPPDGPPTAPGGARTVAVTLHDAPPPSGWRPLSVPQGHPAQADYARDGASGRILLRYPGGPAFAVGPHAIEVYAFAGLRPEELRWYLLGPVAAFYLRLRGRLLLHASAVRVAGRTVAFAGPAGAGKSTLAAALTGRGAEGITDDLLVLERTGGEAGERTGQGPGAEHGAGAAGDGEIGGGRGEKGRTDGGGTAAWLVHPGPGRHLLWPDSAGELAGALSGSTHLDPNPCRWDKRALSPPRWCDPEVPLPLDHLLLLAPAAAGAEPASRPCSPGRAAALLVASLHAAWFGDAERRRTDLDTAAGLVDALGARELVVPRQLDHLPRVAALVEDELRRAAR